jgi:hypothetical protein
VNKILQTNNTAPGGANGSTYNENTTPSFLKLISQRCLAEFFEDPNAVFIDLGSGHGGPSIIVNQVYNIPCVGIEIVAERYLTSLRILKTLMESKTISSDKSNLYFGHGDLSSRYNLEPASIFFCFSKGVLMPDVEKIAKLFNAT